MRKYQELVRPNAPWCPSNIEFIRRINGLRSDEDVRRIVFDADYLVLGLGDVYLGAPVATPLDPRHRLVTTKYNPARTWTPENAVGHRRRLSLHLRHGRTRRLSALRPHHPDVEPLAHDGVFREALAAAVLRPASASFPSRARNCWRRGTRFRMAAIRSGSNRGVSRLPSTAGISTPTRKRSARSRPRSNRRSRPNVCAGRNWGSIRMSSMPMCRPPQATTLSPTGCARSTRRSRARCGR